MTTPRHELCEKVFFGATELMIFIVVSLLITWLVQSNHQVINHLSPPKVIEVTRGYVDVKWHNQRLLDCPTEGQPSFYTPLATEYLESRPVASGMEESTFVRRYFFPSHLLELHNRNAEPDIDYSAELRITVTAHCNPLWPSVQIVRVPFMMPRL